MFLNSDMGSFSVLTCISHSPFNVSRGFVGLRIHLRVIWDPCISRRFLTIDFTKVSRKVISSGHCRGMKELRRMTIAEFSLHISHPGFVIARSCSLLSERFPWTLYAIILVLHLCENFSSPT